MARRALLAIRGHNGDISKSPGHVSKQTKTRGVNAVVIRAEYAGRFLTRSGLTSCHRSQIKQLDQGVSFSSEISHRLGIPRNARGPGKLPFFTELIQFLTSTLDRVALRVKQVSDQVDKLDFLPTIYPVAALVLGRSECRKLGLPIP